MEEERFMSSQSQPVSDACGTTSGSEPSAMVERVARAIAEAIAALEPDTMGDNDMLLYTLNIIEGLGWEPLARAAILAMREPTEVMVARGALYGNVSDAYSAMIDAALAEEPR